LLLTTETLVEPVAEAQPFALSELAGQPVFQLLAPTMSAANAVLEALTKPSRIRDLMQATGLGEPQAIDTVARLAKMGFVTIRDNDGML
jgi:hypothetical protein